VLDEYEDIHDGPGINRGLIGLNRPCAEATRAAHPCPGPERNDRGMLQCPLAGMFGDIFGLVA
jgi:hypothetical protein